MYHLIFVPHYRRKIFANKGFSDGLKDEMMMIASRNDFEKLTAPISHIFSVGLYAVQSNKTKMKISF
jgi:hypothetical protein